MAKPKTQEQPESENMTHFKRTLTVIVAVPKDEAFAAHLKKKFSNPKHLMASGKIAELPSPNATSGRKKPQIQREAARACS